MENEAGKKVYSTGIACFDAAFILQFMLEMMLVQLGLLGMILEIMMPGKKNACSTGVARNDPETEAGNADPILPPPYYCLVCLSCWLK